MRCPRRAPKTERCAAELYAWLASISPAERDAAIERALGIAPTSSTPPGEHLVGHHTSGLAAIVRAIHAVPIRADDRVLDLGAGLGKVLALIHLLTGASVRGVEIQSELVASAIPIANIELGDARACALDASVIFLYCPFEGPVLDEVARRLDALDDVVVIALGIDLPCRRLRRRESPDFWMSIWDSGPPRTLSETPPVAHLLAHETADH